MVKIQLVISWVGTPRRAVVQYQHFGAPCSLHLQGSGLNMDAARCSETLIFNHQIIHMRTNPEKQELK
jgi:hypothetical protein